MNVLDILLLLAAVWFAVIGYRQGFVVGVLSVFGFLGGGLIAIYVLPIIWDDAVGPATKIGTYTAIAAVAIVIIFASVGQACTTHFGNKLRTRITWSPARAIDATGGALVNVLAMLLVAWLIGSALAGTALPTIGREVRSSKVLTGVSRMIPARADGWFADFSSVLAQNGFPQVFTPFSSEPITNVPPPDPKLVSNGTASRAEDSIVKIVGTADSCSKVLEGSGFVFSPHHVMTNAHVVGGVRNPTVQIGGVGRQYPARVVLYDWQRDVAVLDVPSLDAPALTFDTTAAHTGDSAIVAGFPENGPFNVQAARVRARIQAHGPDIYRRGNVSRDVYSLYTVVRQGNSGGPLLTPGGRVYGIVFAKSLDDDTTGYALTENEISSDITTGRTASHTVDTQGCAL
ncbi:MarP family serine protease [Streptantibioticus silvisoli]|uniref:MarP family serine protease n=1 Tax=Streptantibioticus silvisoli TaxID=2705255 RepID=A0ABT6VWV3_9ACTN|nr:MarP family serine protease [Streptantibioticus silvisoli]MDI5962967.1 MarP family serine protease [Streptantibioticus silvisoli]